MSALNEAVERHNMSCNLVLYWGEDGVRCSCTQPKAAADLEEMWETCGNCTEVENTDLQKTQEALINSLNIENGKCVQLRKMLDAAVLWHEGDTSQYGQLAQTIIHLRTENTEMREALETAQNNNDRTNGGAWRINSIFDRKISDVLDKTEAKK